MKAPETVFKNKLKLSFDMGSQNGELKYEFFEAPIDGDQFVSMATGHPDYPGNQDYEGRYVFASGSFFTIELDGEGAQEISNAVLTLDFKPVSEDIAKLKNVTPLCVGACRATRQVFEGMEIVSPSGCAIRPGSAAVAARLKDLGANLSPGAETVWWRMRKVFPKKIDEYKLSGKLEVGGRVFKFDPGIIVNRGGGGGG